MGRPARRALDFRPGLADSQRVRRPRALTLPTSSESLLETIGSLAAEIARHCPDCAEKASRIMEMASEVRAQPVERADIADAIEAQTFASDMSDTSVRTTTEAVVKAVRNEP
jgi:hypothetical protein